MDKKIEKAIWSIMCGEKFHDYIIQIFDDHDDMSQDYFRRIRRMHLDARMNLEDEQQKFPKELTEAREMFKAAEEMIRQHAVGVQNVYNELQDIKIMLKERSYKVKPRDVWPKDDG